METNQSISADFPFESKYIDINGAKMHYVEAGSGDPVLFLHGNPTSSYLWRNIIPYVTASARCIAPDLIGMGKSDKPDLDYSFNDHYRYLEGFIKQLDLKNITLVIHDWGSGLGFHYANQNQSNIKGIAFMEALVRTWSWANFNKEYRLPFKLMRSPGVGWFMISVMNGFLKQMLPKNILRSLSKEEMEYYNAPFKTIGNRKPVRRWPCEIPIDGSPEDVHKIISDYNQKLLQESDIPKLLIYANPGAIMDAETLEWCTKNIKNLQSVNVGQGLHYLQEDRPHEIGRELAKWYHTL